MLLILLHVPAVQQYMGHQTASALSKKLGTQVEVGKVDIGLLNRVIIDDFELYDQQDKKMLSATRLSAKVDIPSLLKGKVSVSSAQLFGMKANLYRETAEAPFNFQFVIDSLSSKEQKEKKPLDLNINSLIIRNGAVNYDQLDAPISPGRLSSPLQNKTLSKMMNREKRDLETVSPRIRYLPMQTRYTLSRETVTLCPWI